MLLPLSASPIDDPHGVRGDNEPLTIVEENIQLLVAPAPALIDHGEDDTHLRPPLDELHLDKASHACPWGCPRTGVHAHMRAIRGTLSWHL